MRYAVLGAGAMGAVVGGLLARGGCRVELWDINEDHIAAINDRGLQLCFAHDWNKVNLRACRPEQGSDADAILVLTKTLHTEAAIASVRSQIERGAHVVGLQNGLGNDEVLARQVPEDQLSFGCTRMPGRYHGPGHVSTETEGSAVFRAVTDKGIETARNIATEVHGFALIHDQTGAEAAVWQKAAFNCALNAITALQGGTVGQLADSSDGVALARDAAAEVVAVAQARGIEADLAAVDAHIDRSLTRHRDHKASMLQDIEAGRETEIEALCGAVVRAGERLGMDTPINRTLAALIRLKTRLQKERAA